ncbi:hypothetical protein FOA52_007166 [Chlamydomonas sp. UWO 241]|nr:hypothetical protein FOA52_007166 [Chlamydomonas sp. UWO 241]
MLCGMRVGRRGAGAVRAIAPSGVLLAIARPARQRMMMAAVSRSGASTQIKICGVTNADDAAAAADAGADFVGMIMWQKAKRGVSDDASAAIAQAASSRGALPVGVFVDEDASTINRRCAAAGIPVAQLHGDGARDALAGLDPSLRVVWVLHCTPEGEIVTRLADSGGRQPDWVLIDGLQGGSGQVLDWTKLSPPPSTTGWLLAGGLKPENVSQAVSTARPSVVDVSSGVCGPDGLQKDHGKIAAFVKAVKEAS